MRKLIKKVFGLKILTSSEYEELLNRVSDCGNVMRKYADKDAYSNYGQRYKVEAGDLSKICHVENLFWEDIKHKLNLS